MAKILGLILEVEKIPDEVVKIAEERKTARLTKDFKKSDQLRENIARMGYNIEDLKDNNYIIKSI